MRPPRPLPKGSEERLKLLLDQARSKAEFQTIQAVWLRAALNLSAKEVALAIGWHPSSVRRVQSLFLREGEAALRRVGRGGGRRSDSLTLKQERRLLEPYARRLDSEDASVVEEIKGAYEDRLGRSVTKSTIHRLLTRHGWPMASRRTTRRSRIMEVLDKAERSSSVSERPKFSDKEAAEE